MAVAATGVLWLAFAWPSDIYLRPLIQAPVVVRADSSLITNGGWTVSEWYQSPAGHHIGVNSAAMSDLYRRATASGVSTSSGFQDWLNRHGYVDLVSYQPESRFWHFQTVESAAYLLLAAILAGVTVWWVRRRAS